MKYVIALLLLLIGTSAEAASCIWQGGTGSWTAINTASWSCGHVPTSADTVAFDGTSGGGIVTVDFGGTITILSLDLGAFTGTWDNSVNNNNITMTATSTTSFSISGSGTRTIKLGSAVYELSGTGSQFSGTTHSNLTFQPGTSTIYMSGSGARTFRGGDLTYANFRNGAMSPTGVLLVINSNTFSGFQIDPPSFIEISGGENTTVTGSVNWNGTTSNKITLSTNANQTSANWVFPAGQTLTYVALRGVNVTSGAPVANNSFDLKNNAGITINPPTASSGSIPCILGGWLLWRDMPEHLNDNFPAWLYKAG